MQLSVSAALNKVGLCIIIHLLQAYKRDRIMFKAKVRLAYIMFSSKNDMGI